MAKYVQIILEDSMEDVVRQILDYCLFFCVARYLNVSLFEQVFNILIGVKYRILFTKAA